MTTGRLRVRNAENTGWLDICQSEFYVRNAANTAWSRLLPSKGMAVRHGANNYWIQIGCKTEDESGCADDAYGGTPDGNGANGSGPGGGTGDTGNGDGSTGNPGATNPGKPGDNKDTDENPNYHNVDKGSSTKGNGDSSCAAGTFVAGSAYPPGYDLPDACGDGFGLIETGDGSLVLIRPGIDKVETYDPGKNNSGQNGQGGGGDSSDGSEGTYADAYQCPSTITGRGYNVTEFYVELGSTSGTVKIPYNFAGGRGSVDVYYHGSRVASTDGMVSGGGVLKFQHNVSPGKGESKVFVRIRSENSTQWSVQFLCPNNDPKANDDKDADYGYGTVAKPAPCHGTFNALQGGGAGVHENVHELGNTAGQVVVEYQMWYQPDKMDVIYRGRVLASTNTHVAGEGRLTFNWNPVGSDTKVVIRISSLDGTTTWAYMLNCPGDAGSTLNPKNCGNSKTQSGGAGVTDTYFDLSGEKAGQMAVRYQMWNIPDKLEVYQNGMLIAATSGAVAGEGYLYFNFDPSQGKLRVRVIGPDNNTTWAFLLVCPSELNPPKLTIGNASAKEGGSGQTSQICFPVTLSEAAKSTVAVDYSMSGFASSSGTLTFAPGETSKQVCGSFVGNDVQDGDKKVTVTLGNPRGAQIANGTGTGTIIDDDSALCQQNPTQVVRETAGGPDGSNFLFVQERADCAAGNVMYLMARYLDLPYTGNYTFNFLVDDDFELYIDCKKVATGTIGAVRTHTIYCEAGTRYFILRYSNIPDCTPSYVAMSILFNNQVVYRTTAAGWLGQANVYGSI